VFPVSEPERFVQSVNAYVKGSVVRIVAFLASLVSAPLWVIRSFTEELGRMLLFLWRSLTWALRPPFRGSEFIRQLDFVGSQSVFLIIITGSFTGMVTALQGYNAMHRYGAESMVGAMVALSLARELGPVLSALMVIGRVGSAMTAELGSMRNTQQIDALTSMAVEPIQYLVVPRILAATVTLPFLAMIFSLSGMIGAYLVATQYLGVDGGGFVNSVQYYLGPSDITHGLTKTLVFGLIMSVIACYKGFYTTGGSRGVGVATTQAVVAASVLVLVFDYVMTTLMFKSR
jgi:phospholipid/cholesterol/gamma-HCH transport system permease protein